MKSSSIASSPVITRVEEATPESAQIIARLESNDLSKSVRDTGVYFSQCVSNEAVALLLCTMPSSQSLIGAPSYRGVNSTTHETFCNDLLQVRENLVRLQTDSSKQSCLMAETLALDEAINVSTSAIDSFLSLNASVESSSQRLLSV